MNSRKINPWHSLTTIMLLAIMLTNGGCSSSQPDKWAAIRPARATKESVTRIDRLIHVASQQGEKVALFSTEPLSYQIFRLSNPERVVLFFPKTQLGSGVQPTVVDDSPITGLFPMETKDAGSKLEITLAKELEYEVQERADGMDILFLTLEKQQTDGKPVLQDLKVSYKKGGTELRLFGRGVVPAPKSFRLANPPRLVVDMVGVAGPAKGKRVIIDSAHANSALLVGGAKKSRLLIELASSAVNFKIADEAGMPVILLNQDDQTPVTDRYVGGKRTDGIAEIKFTREGQGSLLRILLDKKGGVMKTRREDDRLFLSFENTPVAQALLRRMNVTAFGGPVTTIDTTSSGGNTHIIVTMAAMGSRHEVLEQDDEILVRFHPAPVNAGADATQYTGKKVSLDFKDIDVQNALRVIAEISNLNIIFSDAVGGTLTMRLVDVPWDQALDLILEAKGLGSIRQGNVLRVAPIAEIQATAQARVLARQSAKQLESFITELIPVSFADGKDLRTILMEGDQTKGTRLISASGTVSLDKRTNTLIVKDIAENVAKVRQMVQKLDKPIPQVLIEARIVEVDRNSKDEFGINWGFNAKASKSGFAISDSISNAYTAHLTTPGSSNPRARLTGATAPQNVSLLPTSPTGSLGIHLGGLSPLIDLDIEIAALEENNKAKTISSPRVLTTNNKLAKISQGINYPYTTQAENGGTTIAFVEATLSLAVTPQVTPNNFVTLQIEATNDSVAATGTSTSAPAINTKTINTQALVSDGETIVLGGIFQNTQVRNKSGVPGLSSLPFLGRLFKNHADSNTQTELLIFITPHIIHPK